MKHRHSASRALLVPLLVLGLAAGTLAAATPARAASQTLFNFGGRGWGHGIGMSQWGAYGYATRTSLGYKAILKHYYTGIAFGRVGNATIRVRLGAGRSSVKVTSATAFKVGDGSRTKTVAGGVTATVTWSSSSYRVSTGSATWNFSAPVTFVRGSSLLKLLNKNDNGYLGPSGSGAHYRGTLRVVHYTGGFTIVNKLPLESYLYGVVPHEMPASWPLTALKAQACAARSYAARSLGKAGAFDVYCTTASQVYDGYDAEAARTNDAVRATAGVVPTYGGSAISAFYFSTSGGHTENIENVWTAASPQPYLKGVADPYEPYDPNGRTGSRYHLWKPWTWSAATVAGKLGVYTASNPYGVKGVLRSIFITKRGTSPRVVKAYVIGGDGVTAVSGSTLRAKLGLADTWVYIRTMSIDPSAGTHKAITYGTTITLSGRIYPALAEGTRVKVHFYRDGAWQTTLSAPTTRGSQSLGNGYAATYSTYTFKAKPPKTTKYYFSTSKARSPSTTITVRPRVTAVASTVSPAVGESVTFTGTVRPIVAGATLWLQRKDTSTSSATWIKVASTTVDAAGAFSVEWPAVAGTTTLRVRMPATAGLAAGTSPAVTVAAQ